MAKKYNSKKESLEEGNECLELVVSAFKDAKDYQRPIFLNFLEYYKLYRGILDTNNQNYVGRAKLFVPYVFSTVETIMPRMVGSKPKIEAIPREPNDINKAESVSKILDYQWDVMEMHSKLKTWVRNALLYGVGFIKVTWAFEQEGKKIVTDRPTADVIDAFDIFIDPNVTRLKDAKYIIHRTERNIEELKVNKNYNIPPELIAQVSEDEYKVSRDAVTGLGKPDVKDKKKIEVLEYWGKYDINDDDIDENCLIVVANQKYIIRKELNPFKHGKKPFIDLHDTDVPNEFWSIGEVEPLVSLQYELNDVRNQRMDNVTLILNRMWKVAKGADVDEEELVSQAGGVIHAGDINGFEPITTPDVTASAYNEESLIKADMQQASGVTDYTRGIGSGSQGQGGSQNRTATGIMLLQEAGNARFKYKLDNLEDSLREFGKQMIALNQQFIDQPLTIRILGEHGPRWETVSPEEIKGEYDVSVESGSTQPMNKSIRRAEARELLATVTPLVKLFPELDLKYFINHLIQTYDLTDTAQAFKQIQQSAQLPGGIPSGVPGQAIQAQQGPAGAALGGNVGSRGNVSLETMASPIPSGGATGVQS